MRVISSLLNPLSAVSGYQNQQCGPSIRRSVLREEERELRKVRVHSRSSNLKTVVVFNGYLPTAPKDTMSTQDVILVQGMADSSTESDAKTSFCWIVTRK